MEKQLKQIIWKFENCHLSYKHHTTWLTVSVFVAAQLVPDRGSADARGGGGRQLWSAAIHVWPRGPDEGVEGSHSLHHSEPQSSGATRGLDQHSAAVSNVWKLMYVFYFLVNHNIWGIILTVNQNRLFALSDQVYRLKKVTAHENLAVTGLLSLKME